MSHVLIVGGTGMLKGVTESYARNGDAVSVVARTMRRIEPLTKAYATIVGVPVDYREPDALQTALSGAVAAQGPVDLAVVWMHDDADDAPLIVADHLGPDALYVHVLGSAAADPSDPDQPFAVELSALLGPRYRQIILGFIQEERGSRWLTNAEISDGVLKGIASGEQRFIVGTERPWEVRP